MRVRTKKLALFLIGLALCSIPSVAQASDGDPWHVAKFSGEVWVVRGETQRVALGSDTILDAGDNIRTGRNGRVLLTRGEERIVISPNSAIGIPTQGRDGFPTTIAQQAGSILLEVEKKNVQHFEVETPYLAAVVKGTQFRVTVNRRGAHVEVTRGQVQVSDFKSGQNVLVLPGQSAKVSAFGSGGLSLSGKGQLNKIEQGAPRASGLRVLNVPKGGLRSPFAQKAGHKAFARADASGSQSIQHTAHGGIRINAALGEVHLDFKKATHGLAHESGDNGSAVASRKDQGAGGSNGGDSNSGNSNGSGNSASASSNGGGLGGGNGNGNGAGGGNSGNGLGNGGGNGSNAGGSSLSNAGGSGVGSSAASAIASTGGGLGSTVAGVGSTVASVGSTVASVGGTVGSTVGSTVSGVGGLVSGTLGGLLGKKK
ncbi:MAG TPA: FecR domain-containing protein [Pseudolabrys sp.]|nr:FecR domain-containing protein [Pseudolabrys sp.]